MLSIDAKYLGFNHSNATFLPLMKENRQKIVTYWQRLGVISS